MSPNMNEQELLKRIGELPREIEPVHDPWEKISARLDEKQAPAPAPRQPVRTISMDGSGRRVAQGPASRPTGH